MGNSSDNGKYQYDSYGEYVSDLEKHKLMQIPAVSD